MAPIDAASPTRFEKIPVTVSGMWCFEPRSTVTLGVTSVIVPEKGEDRSIQQYTGPAATRSTVPVASKIPGPGLRFPILTVVFFVIGCSVVL
jgi:hypothetical protein